MSQRVRLARSGINIDFPECHEGRRQMVMELVIGIRGLVAIPDFLAAGKELVE
jgi:hypothetical protein